MPLLLRGYWGTSQLHGLLPSIPQLRNVGRGQRLQYPSIKSTINHARDPIASVKYVPQVRDIGVSGFTTYT